VNPLDFIVPNKPPAGTSHFCPSLADATMEEEAACLEAIVLAIEGRYAGVGTTSMLASASAQDSGLVDIVETAACYPSLQEPEICKLSVDVHSPHSFDFLCLDLCSGRL
jgi:hypothetical protein